MLRDIRLPTTFLILIIVVLIFAFADHKEFLFFSLPFAFAHCDTMNGPVIQAAKKALETGNVDLVLIWVQKQNEEAIKKAFAETLVSRKAEPKKQEQTDMHFFEILVRIHRAGEGADFTGLKADESEADPAIMEADKALESGSVDNLVKVVSNSVISGIEERLNLVMERKKHINESIEAGREYVKAYVEFVHYVERLHKDSTSESEHHGESEKAESRHKH